MYSVKELSLIFLIGGLAYGLIEILFRGYTHWTMLLTRWSVFHDILHFKFYNKKQ